MNDNAPADLDASPVLGQRKLSAENVKEPRVPRLPISAVKTTDISASSPLMSPSSPKGNAPPFLTKVGESIARFIHESYFGRKSLARHDMRHAALLGCSQIPDYINLRDGDSIVYSPIMYDNLVTAVTKKFTSELLPQFLNSVSFQVMVSSLMITDFFDELLGRASKKENQDVENPDDPVFKRDIILRKMWTISKGVKQEAEKKDDSDDSSDDTSSSTSSSSSDDDGGDEEEDNGEDNGEDDNKAEKEDKEEAISSDEDDGSESS